MPDILTNFPTYFPILNINLHGDSLALGKTASLILSALFTLAEHAVAAVGYHIGQISKETLILILRISNTN